MSFRTASLLLAVVSCALFLALLFAPGFLLETFSVESGPAAEFVARRTAMLFVGYAAISYGLSASTDRAAQRAASLAYALSMTGLALLGLYEFARGFAGPGIFLAIVTETVFSALFWPLWMKLRAG